MKKEDIYLLVGIVGFLLTALFAGFCHFLMSFSSAYWDYPARDGVLIFTIIVAFLGFGGMIGYVLYLKNFRV